MEKDDERFDLIWFDLKERKSEVNSLSFEIENKSLGKNDEMDISEWDVHISLVQLNSVSLIET